MRGEKVKTLDGMEYTFIEYMPNGYAKIMTDYGKLVAIPKANLDIPIIDTEFYERVNDLPQVQESTD